MIVKRIDNPKQQSSKAARTGNLIDYIAEAKKDTNEKAEYTFATGGFYSQSWQVQRAEMIALSLEATRSVDPIDHWLLSWKEGEVPTKAQCRDAVEILKQHLGMSADHLAMCSLHCNTDNYHLHIVFNRVDPARLRVTDKGWSIDKAHRAVAKIVSVQGWEAEKNTRYVYSQDGRLLRRNRSTTKSLRTQILDRENATGEKSCERLAIEQATPILTTAQNWSQVHLKLARIGMRYEAKGSGAVIWVGDQPVKASAAGRQFSRTRMEERLGTFQATLAQDIAASSNRAPEPLHNDMPAAWVRYQAIQTDQSREKEAAFLNLRKTHRAQRDALFTAFREERDAFYRDGQWRGEALNVARSLLAAEHVRRKAELQEKHLYEREKLRKRFGKRRTYEQYLIDNGEDRLASEWRFRDSHDSHGTLTGEGEISVQIRDIRDFVAQIRTGSGGRIAAIEYRARTAEQVSFTDRGKRIDVAQIADKAAVLAAFQLASQKWGVVAVDGPIEFKLLCAELAAKHGFKIKNPEIHLQAQLSNEVPVKRHPDPYEAHKADILKRIDVRNPSRLDWMIAIRMRVTGHRQEAIAESLKRNVSNGRKQEERDWSKYAERTVRAVFGPRGDREYQQCKPRASAWLRVEGRECASRIIRKRSQGHER